MTDDTQSAATAQIATTGAPYPGIMADSSTSPASEHTRSEPAPTGPSSTPGALDASSLAALTAGAQTRVLPPAAVLFREGDASDAMYLVLSGELRATVGEMIVGRIG